MSLLTLSIPDDPAELPGWLEQRLVASDFRQFIAELLAYFPPSVNSTPGASFDDWLPIALTDGLDPLPKDVLSQLLKHPAALAKFQERIVLEGGAYWDDVLDRSKETSVAFERGKSIADRILATKKSSPKRNDSSTSKKVAKDTPKSTPSTARPRAGRWTRAWAFASTGIAACLAVGLGYTLFFGQEERPVLKSQVAWGWAKPGGLAMDQRTPKDYLNKLASNAEEWSLDRPSSAEGVATRLAEFRLGCSRLMHSQYGTLNPDEKAWLLEQCRTWAKALDGHQQALDGGADPQTVRSAVDETVRTITATLRERAKHVG